MGLLRKIKQAKKLAGELKQVKKEMREVPAKGGLKVRANRAKALIDKLRDVRENMGEWELGQLAVEADKEGKRLDKLIQLAEARERVANAKVSVAKAKERLRVKSRQITSTAPRHKQTKIVFSGLTVRKAEPKVTPARAIMPKRKPTRITPKRPALKR